MDKIILEDKMGWNEKKLAIPEPRYWILKNSKNSHRPRYNL